MESARGSGSVAPIPRRRRVTPLAIWPSPNVNQLHGTVPHGVHGPSEDLVHHSPDGALWASWAHFMGSYPASDALTRFSQNAKHAGRIFCPPFSRAPKNDFGFPVDPLV